mmetsp:Transcript_1837/g.5492  ORF Transcript_1837/g.5492 Transcript_1837/m.5492 type:complete len:447 (-) Transcript_1837:2-1342(-)
MPSLEARERLSLSVHVLVAPPASLLARGRRLAVFGARRLCEKDWRPPPVLRRPRRGRLAGVEAVCGRLPIHVGDRPCPDRREDERVEPVHLVRRADRDRGALVDSLDRHVEDGASRHSVRRLAAGGLDEKAEGRALKGETQLGRRRVASRRVGEHALPLGELLADVGHQPAAEAERVPLVEPVVDKLAVAGQLVPRGAQVGGREDPRLGRDPHPLPRAQPTVRAAHPERELVDAVVEGDKDGGARPVQRHEGRLLVAACRAEDARLGAPDAEDRADGPIIVDDRAPVERVPADAELAISVHLAHFGLLLRGSLLYQRLRLADVPHQVVGEDVHSELHVAKDGLLLLGDRDQLLTQRLGDCAAAVEHRTEHRPQLRVGALGLEDLAERLVAVLCDRVGVEGGVGGAKRGVLGHRGVHARSPRPRGQGVGRAGEGERDGQHGRASNDF